MTNSTSFSIAAAVCALLGLIAIVLSWLGLFPRADRYVFFYLWALFLCAAAVVRKLETIIKLLTSMYGRRTGTWLD